MFFMLMPGGSFIMPFTIVCQDITKLKVDVIVNASNTYLKMGGGVCGAIFKAAGAEKLQAVCDKLAPIETGNAVITPGFDLPAKCIIHTVGPIYQHWSKKESEKYLRAAYTNSLKLAFEKKYESIAFPLISSGIYGYPKDEALQVALSCIKDFLFSHDIDVTLVVFDKSSFSISNKLLSAVKSYVDEHYVDVHEKTIKPGKEPSIEDSSASANQFMGLIDSLDESFSKTLMRLISSKGRTDVEVYKRANIDRKLFSKLRNNESYMPSKRTAIALAVALELSLDETRDLLKRAGYTLSSSFKFDIIVQYFIANGIFDIFEINKVLFSYDLPLLGY